MLKALLTGAAAFAAICGASTAAFANEGGCRSGSTKGSSCYDGVHRQLPHAPYDGVHRKLEVPYDGVHRKIEVPYDGVHRKLPHSPYDGVHRELLPCP